MRALAQELDQRRPVVEAGHAHQVVDVIAVQAVGGRRQDEVAAALLQLVGGQDGRLRAVGLLFGDELEVVRGDVEDAARRAVGQRDGHAAFAGDQADVAHRMRRRSSADSAAGRRRRCRRSSCRAGSCRGQ